MCLNVHVNTRPKEMRVRHVDLLHTEPADVVQSYRYRPRAGFDVNSASPEHNHQQLSNSHNASEPVRKQG